MIIGVPKEIKSNENRVGAVPSGVEMLIKNGHRVIVENNAGSGSGYNNESYTNVGASIVDTAAEVYKVADMIVKVKEPIESEYNLIREGQILFTYFHFAANKPLTEAIVKSKCIAIAYETVQLPDRSLPLLIPMSEVAGRMAPQEGAKYFRKSNGWKRYFIRWNSRNKAC